MSKLGIHKSATARGFGEFLTTLVDASVPLGCVFSLGYDVSADLARYSPTTLSIFRDQRHGATPPDMYATDPIICANNWYNLNVPIWRLNPATYYAYINEEPLISIAGAQWINAFTLQMQRRAHADGFKLCLFEFASGNPNLDLIQYILPCLREGKIHGDVWGQHAYWDAGDDQSFADGPLYYQRILERLPADCQLDVYGTEVSPGNGHNTVPDPEWFAEMDRVDHALMSDPRIKALCAYDLGAGADSDFSNDLSIYAALIISNAGGAPPPTDDLTERVARLEFAIEDLQHELTDLTARVVALEDETPPSPAPVTAHISVLPTSITEGQTAALSWETTGATSVSITPFGPQILSGSRSVLPSTTTTYVLTASGPGGTATTAVILLVTPKPLFDFVCLPGVGVGSPQPLTSVELEAIRVSKVKSVLLFTMPDGMAETIQAVRRVRPDVFIVARLFYSVDSNHVHKFSAQEFVDTVTPGLRIAYTNGVRYFQIHNEPNLIDEGYGWNWQSGAEFGVWLDAVLNILKPVYPDAKWGYPGLSPQPNTLPFIDASRPAANHCDWIAAHSYWLDRSGMTSPEDGQYWQHIAGQFPDKPIMITEFANVNSATNGMTKGQEYADYFTGLLSHPQVMAAHCFVVSWGDDPDHDAWVRTAKGKQSLTDIPITLGDLLP